MKADRSGLGGGSKIWYSCSGCKDKDLHFNSFTYVLESRRSVVSLALAVAFVLSGNTHAGYHNAIARGLGIPVLKRPNFYEVIKLLYAPIRDLLDSCCKMCKEEMHDKGDGTIGSWRRAVTTADGCWMTRGHFSQNFTFIIKDYLTNELLFNGHLCMRGSDDIVDEPLYPGTSKSAEGHMASLLFQRASDEGVNVYVNWQDSDSSSAKAVKDVYPNAQIMHCAGHVGRAHGNRLAELKTSKTFSAAYIRKNVEYHPEVSTVKCVCAGRNHHQGCGCLTEAFIRSARINHFLCCLQAEKDSDEYASRMCQLGKFHARGIHQWEGGCCSFHPQRTCSCGQCEDDDELSCTGLEYQSKFTLSCPLHALAYEIECKTRASTARAVIHTEMGRGHSNLCEAAFNVLPHYRAKSVTLHRLSYMTLTNWGLIMSCLSFLIGKFGADFNPYVHIYRHLKLPIVNGLMETWVADMQTQDLQILHKKDKATKQYRSAMKTARKEEQEERKQWTKKQRIQHSYGMQDDTTEEVTHPIEHLQEEMTHQQLLDTLEVERETTMSSSDVLVITASHTSSIPPSQSSTKSCKCGSTKHKRTSHHSCPMNPRNMPHCSSHM